jgi:hypothetical protein
MFFFLSRKETYIFSAVKSNIVVVPLSKTTVRLCHLSSCGSYPERVEATKVSWFVFSALPIKPECQNHIRSPSRQVRMRLRLIHCWHACPYQLAETMPLLRGLGSCYMEWKSPIVVLHVGTDIVVTAPCLCDTQRKYMVRFS